MDNKNKYITFKSGNEYFALKIQYVSEIIVYQDVTAIPESEDYIKGLINLRGKIIPVIDVRIRFKQEPLEYTDRTCIIIINYEGTVVGLIVEKIAEVVELTDEDIIPSPSFGKADKSQNKYVYAIGKIGEDVKLLLDPGKLLNDEDMAAINKAVEDTDPESIDEAEETGEKI
ncbi:MAG: purine-binding chemotaxis protein CheW [Lachnospiraceae bacterium]|nr:purine-binding chemotaxis protein CheW [Lachnospiraceae bacterium]MBR4992924.1 purine-binding chemotaxis protein CheW [Lachnospiraceae bacterium]MBR5944403.1 purine-binding chemotaxis protein CheW [Lachnospiraceae bacterium]